MRTNVGRDWQCRVMGEGNAVGAGTGTMRPADFIALSGDATAPNLADTSLSGEIIGDGLERAQAAFAHTNGQDSYTLTKTFTATAPHTIEKIGVFNAVSGGTMVFETLLGESAVLVSGDQIAITETVTV